MFTALNEKNEKVNIESASKSEKYFCPICNNQVIFKKGKIRAPHFSHKIDSGCVDWGDMSEWHLGWQQKFPLECREAVIEKDGIKHRADVLIKEKNTVIEFQHSQISNDEFNARNKFYTENGYNLIWIFDGNKKIKRPENYRVGLLKDNFCLNDYRQQTLEWKRYKKDEELLIINHQIVIFYEVFNEKIDKKVLLPVSNYNNFDINIKWLYNYILEENFLKTYSPLHFDDETASIDDILKLSDEFYKINNIEQRFIQAKLQSVKNYYYKPTYRPRRKWHL